MKERQMLFSREMVYELKCGNMTLLKPIYNQPDRLHDGEPYWYIGGFRAAKYRGRTVTVNNTLSCPYGEVGDRLWVREKYRIVNGEIDYFADGQDVWLRPADCYTTINNGWLPSVYMKRALSRYTLEIASVGVELAPKKGNADNMIWHWIIETKRVSPSF